MKTSFLCVLFYFNETVNFNHNKSTSNARDIFYTTSLLKCNLSHENDSGFLIYIQQDATLHSLLYLKTALRVSSGTITHYQERKQLCLQHLVFVTPLLLSAAIAEELEVV
jgi:hypothetical protein